MFSVIKNIRSHQKVPVETLKRLLIISKLQHTNFSTAILLLDIYLKVLFVIYIFKSNVKFIYCALIFLTNLDPYCAIWCS
jgi:hypothetical protein